MAQWDSSDEKAVLPDLHKKWDRSSNQASPADWGMSIIERIGEMSEQRDVTIRFGLSVFVWTGWVLLVISGIVDALASK